MKAEGRGLRYASLPFCLLLSAFCLTCAGAPQQKTPPLAEPEVRISQLSNLAEAATHISGSISVQYRVEFRNSANVPITIKRIDVITIGEGAYTLRPTSTPVDKQLNPGEAAAVEFWAPAFIVDPTIIGANGPVSIRVTTQYDTPNGRAQSNSVQQVHPMSSL